MGVYHVSADYGDNAVSAPKRLTTPVEVEEYISRLFQKTLGWEAHRKVTITIEEKGF